MALKSGLRACMRWERYVDGAAEWIGFRKARLDHAITEPP